MEDRKNLEKALKISLAFIMVIITIIVILLNTKTIYNEAKSLEIALKLMTSLILGTIAFIVNSISILIVRLNKPKRQEH